MRRRVFVAGILLLTAAGCSVVLGLEPPTYESPLPLPDVEAGSSSSGEPVPPPNPPGKLDDPARWSTFRPPGGGGFVAGPFDGRFQYFVRGTDVDGADAGLTGSRILRYDTSAAKFDDPAAWTAFDPEITLGTTGPHFAATMEGKYLIVGGYSDHIFLRFDTTLPPSDFTSAVAWQTFDAKDLGGSTTAYNAAVPLPANGGTLFVNGNARTPLIHKGDPFDAGWEKAEFDGGTFSCGATFRGVCSKTTAYFPPGGNNSVACVARFDPTKPLATGFDSFDVATLGEEYAFIQDGVTSSTHLYLTQYNTRDAAAPVRVIRRPLDGALDAGWEAQPTNLENPLTRGFIGGTYDGRFVYFAPYPVPTSNVIFSRYDTTLGFNDPAAWDVAAAAALGIPANRYWGASFDGQYVYYSTYTGVNADQPTFARFKAYDTKIAAPGICH